MCTCRTKLSQQGKSTIPAGRERQRAVCDRRRRILSAELIEYQKTRLFHSYLGAILLENLNINGHGNSTESERNNRNTSRKRSRSTHFGDSQLLGKRISPNG